MSFHSGPISHIYGDLYYESLIGEGLKGLKCKIQREASARGQLGRRQGLLKHAVSNLSYDPGIFVFGQDKSKTCAEQGPYSFAFQ